MPGARVLVSRPVARRVVGALAAIVIAATSNSRLAAHEIGTTHVAVALDNGRYAIDVVTDAASLADKLEAISGEPSGDRSAGRVRGQLLRDDGVFRSRVHVRFGDADVRPEITYRVSPAADATSAPVATIHLTGDVPAGARAMTWSYGWTFATYAITIRHDTSEQPATQWLEGGDASRPIALHATTPRATGLATAARYLSLGFTHIVPYGLDHVLFVLGLFLLGGGVRTVLWQVSAFTVAHSITLALCMLGVLSAPPAIVEPMIAVSIAYVAIENLLLRELRSWRVALVFAFGLLHGLGFAGALRELGLPPREFLTALVTFNLGVEAGQMTVLAIAFALVGWLRRSPDLYRRRIVVPASLAIACTAIYWTVQRLPVW